MIDWPEQLTTPAQLDRYMPDGKSSLVESGADYVIYLWRPTDGGEYRLHFDFAERQLITPDDLPSDLLALITARMVDREPPISKREKMRRYRTRVEALAGTRLADLTAAQVRLLLGGLLIRNNAVEIADNEMVVAPAERWL